MELGNTTMLLLQFEDRAHIQCLMTRLKQIRARFARKKKTIADSHALFDRIRVGPIASRQHWLKCKLHWFTTPESARLYQAELEIKKNIGEAPVMKRWWDEADHQAHIYRIEQRATDLHLQLEKAKKYSARYNEEEIGEWNKNVDPLTEEDMRSLRENSSGDFTREERQFYLPGAKEATPEDGRRVAGQITMQTDDETNREYDKTKAGDFPGETTEMTKETDFSDPDRRLWIVPANLDDSVVANAYSVVRSIDEACQEEGREDKGECTSMVHSPAVSEVGAELTP